MAVVVVAMFINTREKAVMEVKLVLLQGQEKRIRRALKKHKGLRLTFTKSDSGDGGDGQQQQQMSGT